MAVEVRIETAPRHNNDQHVEMTFEIINNTAQDIYVLEWYTPLEGLKSDCLNVTVNGHKVRYDGLMVKRGKPGAEDYVLIKAGASVETKVNLDDAYDVSEQGEYHVTFDTRKLVIKPARREGLESFTETRGTPTLEVAPQPTNFYIEAGAKPQQTIGERMREETKKKEITRLVLEAARGLRDPEIIGGTGRQRRSVKIAHKNGYNYASAGIKNTGDNKEYKEWFGEHTNDREEIVKGNFTKVKKRMESTEFTYDLDGGGGCRKNYYAVTTPGGSTIWLCPLFWGAPSKGIASKAGTLLHEHTHASAWTDDLEYGEDECRELAIINPDDAINNADNHEFFVEHNS